MDGMSFICQRARNLERALSMPVLNHLPVFHAEHHRIIAGACAVTFLFAGLTQLRMPATEPPTKPVEITLQLITDSAPPPAAQPPSAQPPSEPPPSEPAKPKAQVTAPSRDTAPAPTSPLSQPPLAMALPAAVPHAEPATDKPTEPPAERAAAVHAPSTPTITPSAAAKTGTDKPVAPQAAATPAAPPMNTAAELTTAREQEGAKPATIEEAFVARVRAVLEANKRYPTGREASQQRPKGQVRLWFALDRQGVLIDCGLLEGSPSMLLDRAALSTLRRSVFPPFPPDAWRGQEQHRFTAQLDFIAPG